MSNENQKPQGTNILPEPEGYISKEEVARRMGKTVRTVDNYMRNGILPFYKLGRTVAFRWSDIEAHLSAHHRVCLRRG